MPLLLRSLAVLAGLALAAACGGGDAGPARSDIGPEDTIAFGAREAPGGPFSLYTVRSDGAGLEALTTEQAPVSFPRWSPAGDRLAYTVGDGAAVALRLHDFETGTTTTVSEDALPNHAGPASGWSPDGERLAFVRASDGLAQVYDLETGATSSLGVEAAALDWSPAGDELALARSDGLYLVDADGGDLRLLVQQAALEGAPRWSPDGETVAFWTTGEPPAAGELFLVDRDGEAQSPGDGLGPAWTPDGERFAFSRPVEEGSSDLDVFVADATGGDAEPLSQSITLDRWPTWSPESDAIAYLAEADQATAFVCVVRLGPEEERDCLDLGDLRPSAPAWSPK